MAYRPRRASGLLMPYNEVPHLFAVMNDPCRDGFCLVLMITSIKKNKPHDPTCILRPGDHPFLARDSWVLYRMAETPRAAHLANMVEKRLFVEKDAFDPPVYERIRRGIWISDQIRPRIVRYAEDVGI